MNRRSCIFAMILFSLVVVHQSFAEYSPLSVPDSSEIRKDLIDSWFTRDFEELRSEQSFIAENMLGEKFQVRMEEFESEFAIVVAPASKMELSVHSESGVLTKEADFFPYNTSGSWVLYRDKVNGKALRIVYYFQPDAEIYIQIRPYQNKTLADMYIYNSCPARNVNIGLHIDDFYTLSFSQLYTLSSYVLPWTYFNIQNGMYDASLQMIAHINDNAPRIHFTSDCSYDSAGQSVFISSGEAREIEIEKDDTLFLDSAGFAKWVVDGLVYAQTGSYLNLDPLKRQTVKTTMGTMGQAVLEKYNVYFALDWTRNLAAAWMSIMSGKDIMYENSGVEVTLSPFASVQSENGIERYDSYISGTGYSVSILKAIMYILAVSEPERMYLGAIKQTDGMTPEVMYYNEVAVFFPFFDAQGYFHCTVYEAGIEKNIDEFSEDWARSFVNLVRLKTSQRFLPQ